LQQQVADQHLTQPALRRRGIESTRQPGGQRACKRAAESSSEQGLHQRDPHRITPPRRAPGKARQLVLQHAA